MSGVESPSILNERLAGGLPCTGDGGREWRGGRSWWKVGKIILQER